MRTRDDIAAESLSQWYDTASGYDLRAQIDAVFAEYLRDIYGRYALTLECADIADIDFDGVAYATVDHTARLGPRGRDIRADFNALPIEAESVSLIVAAHIFEASSSEPRATNAAERLAQVHAILDEIDRVLEPDGHVIVIACNTSMSAPAGVRSIRPHIIRDQLLKRGFVVDAETYIGLPSVFSGCNYSRRQHAHKKQVGHKPISYKLGHALPAGVRRLCGRCSFKFSIGKLVVFKLRKHEVIVTPLMSPRKKEIVSGAGGTAPVS